MKRSVSNLKIYEKSCRNEVLNKLQFQKDHVEYNLEQTMFACLDKGKKREKQEDSALILKHPANKGIRLIAVADGVGGSSDGELASNHALKKIIMWFEGIDPRVFNNIQIVQKSLEKRISNILSDLDASPWASTTLSVAVICDHNTLIANIGDSRIYTYRPGKLKQETKDDNKTEDLYEEDIIPTRELTRFHKNNNDLTKAITMRPNEFDVSYKIIKNDYDAILAITDGITDCLSFKEIFQTIENSQKSDIAINLVNKAKNNNSDLDEIIKTLPKEVKKQIYDISEIIEEDYDFDIEGGKDNLSAAVYVKVRK